MTGMTDMTAAASADRRFMARALALAERGRFTTDPNPCVGCVIVRDGAILGEGWHRRAGEPHAERYALRAAGAASRGATAYVTLEPCCHHGRTAPCADALIESGIARVVCAMVDPNPLVAGQGLERLRAAGLEVESGAMATEARALNPGFVQRMERGRPFVRCKLAASLDGRTALENGESRWITSAPARRDVQLWRARSSALLTGIGTVLADDPRLNLRLSAAELPGMETDAPVRQPRRVILDSRWRTPPRARMLNAAGHEPGALAGPVLIVGAESNPARMAALEAAGAETLVLGDGQGRVDVAALMVELARREQNEVMVESGPTLAGALLMAGLIDECLLYLAPHLLGARARGLFDWPALTRMDQRIALDLLQCRQVGPDLRLRLRPEHLDTTDGE